MEKLLAHFGMKLVKQIDFYRPLGLLDQELSHQQQIHEVAHFQVSSPSRRLMTNFGMGEDTVGSGSSLPIERHVAEETRAILLTLYWYDVFNITCPQVTFRFHGEYYSVSKDVAKRKQTQDAFIWLLTRNLLGYNLKPTREQNREEG